MSQSLLNEVKFPTEITPVDISMITEVAIPFKWGQVSYYAQENGMNIEDIRRNPF